MFVTNVTDKFMVAFGHTAVGAVVGLTVYNLGIHNPTIGLISAGAAGVVSHFIADSIPHGHFFKFSQFKQKIIAAITFDLFLSIVLFSSLAYYKFGLGFEFFYILFGIGGSQLPDIFDGLIYLKILPNQSLLKLENQLHLAAHWHGAKENALIWGPRDIWQIITLVISLVFILAS